jgi:hypothetical protein
VRALIPAFLPTGLLPAGRYLTDVREVEGRLVAPFGLSMTRRRLYAGWRERREQISVRLPLQMEWAGGSFCTAKRDPADFDVVVFFRAEEYVALDAVGKAEVDVLLAGLGSRFRFGTHSFPVAILPTGDPSYDRYLRTVGYWDRWWSTDRMRRERGYFEVRGEP